MALRSACVDGEVGARDPRQHIGEGGEEAGAFGGQGVERRGDLLDRGVAGRRGALGRGEAEEAEQAGHASSGPVQCVGSDAPKRRAAWPIPGPGSRRSDRPSGSMCGPRSSGRFGVTLPGMQGAGSGAPSNGADKRDTGDDAAWVERLRAGEDTAFAELVESNTGQMLAVARRLLRNEDDARDAVQDAFLSAFKALDGFAGEARLSTWLHRITVNAALMKLRTRRRRPEGRIDELLPGFLEDGRFAKATLPWSDQADKLLEKKESRGLVSAAIDRLPEKYRTVLILRDIEGFDTEQTADALGLTVPGVKTRLHRARQGLRGLLDRHFARGTG